MVARLRDGRTLSYWQRESPVQHTAEKEDMSLTHRQLFDFMKTVSQQQKAQRFTAGVCIPDTSLANALSVPVGHVRELLADLAENGKVHRTSVDRAGNGSWCLGKGI